MGLFNFFNKSKEITIYNVELKQKIALYENVINRCVSIISKMCSKCEIEYFKNENGKVKPVKNDTYYKLNVKANPNETATELLNKFFDKLLRESEALIVAVNKNLYVADYWQTSNMIIKERQFYDIRISNSAGYSTTLNKTFMASEVIYVSLNDNNIKKVNADLFGLYADLFSAANDNYIYSNILKFRITPPNATVKIKDAKTGQVISNEDYKDKISDGLLDKKSSLLMLQENIKLDQINSSKTSTSTDLFNVKNEYYDEIASNYHIPLPIFYSESNVSKEQFDNFITFGVYPILALFENSLNVALIPKDDYEKGDRIYIAKHNFRHQDILSVASSVNLLFGDGYSHNDINKFMNLPAVDEPWAYQHHITKNVEDATISKGGDESE